MALQCAWSSCGLDSAGIASLSQALQKAGISPYAFLEGDPLLFECLKERYPTALAARWSESEEWKQWTFPKGAVICVCGGPRVLASRLLVSN